MTALRRVDCRSKGKAERPVGTLQLTSKRKVPGIRMDAMGANKDAAFLPRQNPIGKYSGGCEIQRKTDKWCDPSALDLPVSTLLG